MIATNYGKTNPAFSETNRLKSRIVLKMSKASSKTKPLSPKRSLFSPNRTNLNSSGRTHSVKPRKMTKSKRK